MQPIIQNGIFIYLWVFLVTSVMLFMEINAARRVSTLTNRPRRPTTWKCSNILAVLSFALFPPVGWVLTWFVHRNRVQLQKEALET